MITKVLKTQLLTLLTLISFLMSALAAEETVLFDELYELDGVYFQKFTSEPFNGTATVYLDDQKTVVLRNEKYVNGKIVYEEEFCTNGRLKYKRNLISKFEAEDGIHTVYHCNGNVESRWELKNGVMDGPHQNFWENGILSSQHQYSNGALIKTESYDDYGVIQSSEEFKGSLNQKTTYHPNGKVAIKANYKNDKKDGEVLHYSEDGDLFRKEKFKEGKKDGLNFIFHKKEGITEEWLFKNGNSLKPFTPLTYLKGFPICFVKSSNGQLCKSFSEEERLNFNFNEIPKHPKRRFKYDVDWPKSIKMESKDWRYILKILPIEEVEKQTFFNPNTSEFYDAIVGNKVKFQITDESLTATYYTVVTYDLEFDEKEENWFLIGSVVDDLRGSEDDRKVIGKYRKYDPPIPFLEITE